MEVNGNGSSGYKLKNGESRKKFLNTENRAKKNSNISIERAFTKPAQVYKVPINAKKQNFYSLTFEELKTFLIEKIGVEESKVKMRAQQLYKGIYQIITSFSMI